MTKWSFFPNTRVMAYIIVHPFHSIARHTRTPTQTHKNRLLGRFAFSFSHSNLWGHTDTGTEPKPFSQSIWTNSVHLLQRQFSSFLHIYFFFLVLVRLSAFAYVWQIFFDGHIFGNVNFQFQFRIVKVYKEMKDIKKKKTEPKCQRFSALTIKRTHLEAICGDPGVLCTVWYVRRYAHFSMCPYSFTFDCASFMGRK